MELWKSFPFVVSSFKKLVNEGSLNERGRVLYDALETVLILKTRSIVDYNKFRISHQDDKMYVLFSR